MDGAKGVDRHELDELIPDEKEIESAEEEAIISFWSVTKTNILRCNFSFKIPNPKKRQVLKCGGTIVHQVLFQDKEKDEVFFFFEE